MFLLTRCPKKFLSLIRNDVFGTLCICNQDCILSLLEEQTDQLSRGSTGLITWQGATCLLDWAEWSQELDNKTVLELGINVNIELM